MEDGGGEGGVGVGWVPSCCSTSERASISEGSVRAGCKRERRKSDIHLDFLPLRSTHLLSWLHRCAHNVPQCGPTVVLEVQRAGQDGEVHAGENVGGTSPLD